MIAGVEVDRIVLERKSWSFAAFRDMQRSASWAGAADMRSCSSAGSGQGLGSNVRLIC